MTMTSPIPAFAVVKDIELGRLLPECSSTAIRDAWNSVGEKSTTVPKDDRYSRLEKEAVSTVEACSMPETGDDKKLVFTDFGSVNLFAKAVHQAFYYHYPLRLSPDVLWQTVIQGLAKHVSTDPEKFRSQFVDFDGTKTLVVVRPDFVKGSARNDWTAVFDDFTALVEKNIGKTMTATLTSDFSCTSKTDQICSQIALMDNVQHYFEYEMVCGCGIPSIELTGTPSDWTLLREKAEILKHFDMEWWTNELYPVLDHFVAAAEGKPDIKFWKNICNLHGASGFWSSYVTGWVQVFFPYLSNGSKHTDVDQWRAHYEKGTGNEIDDLNNNRDSGGGFRGPNGSSNAGWGLDLEIIPGGLSQAPIRYNDVNTGKTFRMSFNAGIIGILQDQKTRALEPVNGWAVLDHGEEGNLC